MYFLLLQLTETVILMIKNIPGNSLKMFITHRNIYWEHIFLGMYKNQWWQFNFPLYTKLFFVRYSCPSMSSMPSFLQLFVSTCLIKTVTTRVASTKCTFCAIIFPQCCRCFFKLQTRRKQRNETSTSPHVSTVNILFPSFGIGKYAFLFLFEKQLSLIWYCSHSSLITIKKNSERCIICIKYTTFSSIKLLYILYDKQTDRS